MVTDWAGDTEAWLASGDILAAPPAVHEVLLDLAERRLNATHRLRSGARAGWGQPSALVVRR